jgi:hypothetical protein
MNTNASENTADTAARAVNDNIFFLFIGRSASFGPHFSSDKSGLAIFLVNRSSK